MNASFLKTPPCLLAFLCFCSAGWAPVQGQSVLISEIFYRPSGTNVLEEWVELHNPAGSPADVSGWKLTKGVSFVAPPSTVIAPGGFLVIAANAGTFRATHPETTNFVAGWTGVLSDDGEEIELTDSSGEVIDSVAYAPEGDWAVRRLGAPDTYNRLSWEWFAEHDGLGKSLELINRALPNEHAHNWASSIPTGGTPGASNSAASANIAPLVTGVSQFPAIPKSSEAVAIVARLFDEESSGVSAAVHWRIDGALDFASSPMFDDGAHGDGLPNDGLWGMRIPAQPDGTIVEYFLTARDSAGNERTHPRVQPSNSARTANLLLQFDDELQAGTIPLHRLIMSKAEYDYLKSVWSSAPNSDAEVNGTFAAIDRVAVSGPAAQVRQNASFRHRGHGSRFSTPHNFHVSIPKDRPWGGRFGINLNTQETPAQMLGSELMRRTGSLMAESRAVRVRVNGEDLASPGAPQYGAYVANEQFNGTLVKRQVPGDPDGNLYRGMRDVYPGNPKADLAWHGPSFDAYTNAYFKETNEQLKDYSDLIGLTDALNNAPAESYLQQVSAVANVRQWMRHFAMHTLLDNQETTLATGDGDDYGLYRGVLDPRFVLVAYDLDSILGEGTRTVTRADGLFRMQDVPAMDRMTKHPEIARMYYEELLELIETVFRPERLNPVIDQIAVKFPPGPAIQTAMANLKAFNVSHLAYVQGLIPLQLSVTNHLAVAGDYPRATNVLVTIDGRAHAARTRAVRVNGATAAWTAWRAEWKAEVTLHPGMNRVLIEALDATGRAFETLTEVVWFDDGSVAHATGVLVQDAIWAAGSGPFQITNSLTIPSGVTLRIEPGTTIFFDRGARLIVASGGRLLAEGTAAAPIRFTRAPEETGRWAGIEINGGADSPESRLSHAHIEFNGSTAIHSTGGTVLLEHLTFGSDDRQYVSLDESSFIVRECHFPSASSEFELVHGSGGIKAGGHGIFTRNFFGAAIGYNDVIDFTGGQRPGPIVHMIDNVFIGSGDDLLDLDGTDAWVEGNIFLHAHRNGSPDSSSAVSGGSDGSRTSRITVIGNLIYDCDHAATAKQGNFYTLLNNTIVRQTKKGGLDSDAAVVNFNDETAGEGAGMHLEGNIIYDAEKLTRNLVNAQVTFTNNLMPFAWAGPGGGNSPADPLLAHVPDLAETRFDSWASAQVMREWLRPLPGSPALDRSAFLGAAIGGLGDNAIDNDEVELSVGPVRAGAGWTHYRWRLDSGAWSAETPASTPIQLAALAAGEHQVEVSGKRDSGLFQDDARFAPANPTSGLHWRVDPTHAEPSPLRRLLNEVLARNVETLTMGETTPDYVELHNASDAPLDLSGLSLSDDLANPRKFTFGSGVSIPARGFLLLVADSETNSPGVHLGFSLDQNGEAVLLTDRADRGGALLDSISFGAQIADYSIGRRADGSWGLGRPTPGAANLATPTGPVTALKINEWLANARFVSSDDFIEIYNPSALPVQMGGCYLSDAPGTLARHEVAELSFVGAGAAVVFRADGNEENGPNHLNFKLAAESGTIHLLTPELKPIDVVSYGPQQTDVSQGRTPSGADALAFFTPPTPGSLNPGGTAPLTNFVYLTRALIGFNQTWRYEATGTDLGAGWHASRFDDAAWPSGAAPLGLDSSTPFPYPLPVRTPLPLFNSASRRIKTFYFRTHFDAGSDIAGLTLRATNYLDDGAVFYLNGARAGAIRVKDDPALYSSDASNQSDEGGVDEIELSTAALLPGENVLAVEVHQSGSSSSDVMFAMALGAVQTITNVVPVVRNPVVLNELLVRNQTLSGPNGRATAWVELINPSTNAVDLGDLSLTDNPSAPRRWVFPAGTTIGPQSFLSTALDALQPASATNAAFAPAWNGGTIYLYDSLAQGGGALDAVSYGLQTPDFAIGRVPDGSGSWVLTLPTRAAANAAAGLGSPEALRLNEWMADPAAGADWFELCNLDGAPVALGGLFATDDLGNRNKSALPPLSFLGAGRNGFVQLLADRNLIQGANHVDFRLSKAGSALGLFAASGLQIDALNFGAQTLGVSQGRLPDGAGAISSFPGAASPNAPNSVTPAPLDFDGDGMPDDWEAANGLNKFANDSALDLDGDGLGNLAEFKAGTDPRNASSTLRLNAAVSTENRIAFAFAAQAAKRYRVEQCATPGLSPWTLLREITAQPTASTIQFVDAPAVGENRFYRLVAE